MRKLRDGADGEKTNGDGTAFKKSGDYNENGRPNASGDDSDSDEDGDGIGGDAYLTSFLSPHPTGTAWNGADSPDPWLYPRLRRERQPCAAEVSTGSGGGVCRYRKRGWNEHGK